MKFNLYISLFVLLTYTSSARAQSGCTQDNTATFLPSGFSCPSYDGWVLAFEDNFDGSSLNLENWEMVGAGGARSNYCQNTLHYNKADGSNLEITNGTLKIIAKEENITARTFPDQPDNYAPDCNGHTYGPNLKNWNYTSGEIWTRPKLKFEEGFFEIRCKIPSVDGVWPGFWMYGWGGQEIDVFEFWNDNINQSPSTSGKKVHLTYHMHQPPNYDGALCSYGPNNYTANVDLSNDFHTYSVEWDQYSMIWRLDGQVIGQLTKYYNSLGQQVNACNGIAGGIYYRDPYWPVFSANIGITLYIKNLCEGTTYPEWCTKGTYPTQYEIDYVRVYKKINCSEDLNLCNFTTGAYNDDKPHVYTGRNIVVGDPGCDDNVWTDHYIDLIASNSITINPGFNVHPGSNFTARIDQTVCQQRIGSLTSKDDLDRASESISKDDKQVINIFPNPSTGIFQLNIQLIESKLTSIQLYNPVGQIVMDIAEEVIDKKQYKIDLSAYNEGIYLLRIVAGEEIITKKLNLVK